jgi:excisionase family DNA binding protein
MSKEDCFRIYNVKDVAAILKVCTQTVRNYIKEGKIKPLPQGGTFRITHSELEKFIIGGDSENKDS